MIPLHLTISGFLSYREPVDVDFTQFDLACISGANGAGKSSLLDAITWVLFGNARKRDDSLIHMACDEARVTLAFSYEGNIYRVQRIITRSKHNDLQFHIAQNPSWDSAEMKWKNIGDGGMRATQGSIESTLRLDYDTFVNASFILQGKADQFTTQKPADRKRLLSSVLGLEVWETYREKAADKRKVLKARMDGIDGQIEAIDEELSKEDELLAGLHRLKDEQRVADEFCDAQKKVLDGYEWIGKMIQGSQETVRQLALDVTGLSHEIQATRARLDELEASRRNYLGLVERSDEIRAAYLAWEESRYQLEHLHGVFMEYTRLQQQLAQPNQEISLAKNSLESNRRNLLEQQNKALALQKNILELENNLEKVKQDLQQAKEQLEQKPALETQKQELVERRLALEAENKTLRAEMLELDERISQLKEMDEALCSLCGQPLDLTQRQELIRKLQAEGTAKGDRFRQNKDGLTQLGAELPRLDASLAALKQLEASLNSWGKAEGTLMGQIHSHQAALDEWQEHGQPQLQQVEKALASEDYAHQARQQLAQLEAQQAALAFDVLAYDALKTQEERGRSAQQEHLELGKAVVALEELNKNIEQQVKQLRELEDKLQNKQAEHEKKSAELAENQKLLREKDAAEANYYEAREKANQLLKDVGAASQKVHNLENLRKKRMQHTVQRAEMATQVAKYIQLEKAFGKDGVPALLIEQALPQIEDKANQILDRLSDGNLTIRFITQSQYKDKARADLKETLDIQISDGAGTRDYEMFSGGEAFRVNFAVRLALSEVLAQRAGARLQTLVIDEGFGSQDSQGRQRLIQAINMVRQDFAKILVITHIEELKDAFPTRIEVEKTPRGSIVRVI